MKFLLSASLVLLTACFATAEESGLNKLFHEGILDAKGETATMDQLKDKVIGVYFSAHWCGPCRAFTPKLVEYHEANKDHFEVVFVSSDKSEEKQFEYMAGEKMPWYTMKYKSDSAEALKKKFQVRGIPKLVLLRANGETITGNGRDLVSQKVAAERIAKAKVEQEEYKCGKCDKMHTRPKLVFADEVRE